MDNPRRATQLPWGRAAALATACLVTFIGVVNGLGPETILQRALVAAALTGIVVGLLASLTQYVIKQTQ